MCRLMLRICLVSYINCILWFYFVFVYGFLSKISIID